MPRPAAVYDVSDFVIIGKTLKGATSLPSGHSIAAFLVVTIVLFAFMPKQKLQQVLWSVGILALGFGITFSRVGVGAHYPLDVVIGSTIGFIVTVLGTKLAFSTNWLAWIRGKYAALGWTVVILVWIVALIQKITKLNLPIFYLAVFSLLITLSIIVKKYVRKTT